MKKLVTDGNEHDAGFKRPPKASRFKPGESGNRRGRPKGSRNLKTDLNALMKKRISVRQDGETRHVSRQEAILLALFSKAAHGDVKAATTLVGMVMKLNPEAQQQSESAELTKNDKRIIEDFLRRHSAGQQENEQ
jgi:hypothetical protein